jgi:amidase
MAMTNPLLTSARHQAQLIRSRQLSPTELTQLYLERIDRFNPALGAFFHVARERAIETAAAQTAQLMAAEPTTLPPLFGLPTAIKDLQPVAGMPCSYGVAMLQQNIATSDDAMSILANQAGCNILGKTAISELASFPYSESPGFLPTRNPWNLQYTAGGSSGGLAAAVAAHLLPFGPGSDGGGSLRGPAHCCGLVAIKPTRGRISDAPVGDRISGLGSHGPIARNVADAAALLDALSQRIPGDLYCLPAPQTSFLAAADRLVPALRIGVCASFWAESPLSPSYQAALNKAKTHLAAMGHQLLEVHIDASDLLEPFVTVWQTAVAAASIPAPALGDFNQWLMARSGSAGDYLNALYLLQTIARRILAQWQDFDVLLAPVYSHSTIPIGAWAALPPAELLDTISRWISPCPVFNATGQPSLILPVALEDPTNLPIGIQLVGNLGAEELLIALGANLEAALNFTRPEGEFFW